MVHLGLIKEIAASGQQVGGADMNLHLGGEEGVVVEREVLLGDGIEDKFHIKGAAILEHILRADITLVVAEAEVDLGVASGLFGSVSDCVERSGRDAIYLRQIQPLLHKVIEDTGGV